MKNKEYLNYFSEKEKKSMNKFKKSKDILFLSISKVLMKLGLTADTISYFGLLMLLGFIYFIFKNPLMSLVFLLLHVIADAFDGPLARLMKQEGDSGAFTDIICDHTGMVVVIITLIWVDLINPIISSVYIYAYTILVVFLIVRNQIKRPAKFVFRTKYFVYFLYGFYVFFNKNYLDLGIVIFSLSMIPPIISSYIVIKNKLK